MEDIEGIPDLKNNLWKRQEQLDRWKTSEVNSASSAIRDREKSLIQFPDSFVFLAACSAFDEDEILRLIQKGADINTSNVDGLTALHQVSIFDLIYV
jgi:protein phosphatase 1 regulatory subunit 12A